ncbi:hypothetical protein [Zhongshania sp. BJYM1]|uniref:hypothetical protein n=1 Tax=Zhongshania aquatica TaxID=2965069 RepID=UPI0022B2BC5B|nr:hypothetical protein [Marortus sp. BJYM1]
MDRRPSAGYLVGIIVSALGALALVVFLFVSGAVSVFKASLITLGVGSLIYYYALPIIAKRQNFIGAGPEKQLVQVNLVPYFVFVLIFLAFAGYGWYANI